jgi:hypothetical protein
VTRSSRSRPPRNVSNTHFSSLTSVDVSFRSELGVFIRAFSTFSCGDGVTPTAALTPQFTCSGQSTTTHEQSNLVRRALTSVPVTFLDVVGRALAPFGFMADLSVVLFAAVVGLFPGRGLAYENSCYNGQVTYW